MHIVLHFHHVCDKCSQNITRPCVYMIVIPSMLCFHSAADVKGILLGHGSCAGSGVERIDHSISCPDVIKPGSVFPVS